MHYFLFALGRIQSLIKLNALRDIWKESNKLPFISYFKQGFISYFQFPQKKTLNKD